ncbi:MAG: MBL fold metallo-hydrolase [Pseudomonadota bacterium]
MAPLVARITANNPSPFTFHGTNTYLLGQKSVAVIDPGPPDDAHYAAIIAGIAGRDVSHIIVTHTHMDHSPLARRLAAETGAPVFAEGPHRPARPLQIGEVNPLDASADMDFQPDIAVTEASRIVGDEWELVTHLTPGHTANHAAFSLVDTDFLFSGDHVMAWATSIVAPPDGAMADYMNSLDTLLGAPQTTYFPGHGGRVFDAHRFVRALKAHRRMREQAVLDQIRKGIHEIPAMVAIIYRQTDKRLHQAAGLSVLAHIEDLVARGAVETDGDVRIDGIFRAV